MLLITSPLLVFRHQSRLGSGSGDNDDLYDDYNDYHIRRMRITMITADCHGEPTVTFSNCDDDDDDYIAHGNVEQIC